jgi:hypothetical protein
VAPRAKGEYRLVEHESRFLDLLARQAADLIDHKQSMAAAQQHQAGITRMHRIAGLAGIDIDLREAFNHRCSDEYAQLHGLLPGAETESQQEWLRRVHPDDRRRAQRDPLDALAAGGAVYESEYRIVRSPTAAKCAGSLRAVKSNGTPMDAPCAWWARTWMRHAWHEALLQSVARAVARPRSRNCALAVPVGQDRWCSLHERSDASLIPFNGPGSARSGAFFRLAYTSGGSGARAPARRST